jgi:hypothetical protein
MEWRQIDSSFLFSISSKNEVISTKSEASHVLQENHVYEGIRLGNRIIGNVYIVGCPNDADECNVFSMDGVKVGEFQLVKIQ